MSKRTLTIGIAGGKNLADNTWSISDEEGSLVAHGHFGDGGAQTLIDEDGGLSENLIYGLVEYALEG